MKIQSVALMFVGLLASTVGAQEAEPPKATEGTKPASKPGQTVATFFGTTVESRRPLFVIDYSDSMRFDAEYETKPEKRNPRVPADLRPASKSKIDNVRYHLKKTLFELGRGAAFDLVFFNREILVFKPEMVPITPASLQEACKFIDETPLEEKTWIYDAMKAALKIATAPDGTRKSDGPDAIYLLSDGLPRGGEYFRPKDVIREIGKLNETLRIPIHTLLFESANGAEAGGPEFMKDLASKSGGTFLHLAKAKK